MSANSPNPLLPQGSLQQQTSKAKSNVKVAVYSIVAVHAVLIFGVLMQGGCKKDEPKPTTETFPGQPTAPLANTDTNAPYYGSPNGGPATPATDPLASVPAAPAAGAPVTPPAAPSVATPATPTAAHPTAPAIDTGMAAAPAAPAEAAGPVQQYKVAKGDNFYTIAKKNKITVAKLTAANPGVDSSKLKIGQTLNIPAPAATTAPATSTASASAPAAPAAEAASGATTTYEVKSGDTLFGISKKTGASVKAIRAANNMKTDRINVGMKLKIPAKATASAAPATPAPEPVITSTPVTPTPSAPSNTTSGPAIPVTPRTR